MSNEKIYIEDILEYLGSDWLYQENEYENHFRYISDKMPDVKQENFTKQFPGFSFNMYKVGGGIGWIIVPGKIYKNGWLIVPCKLYNK